MKPGRELDALIAEKVMGLMEFAAYAGPHKASIGWGKPGADFTRGELTALPNFSTSIEAAWEVVEEMHRKDRKPGQWGGFKCESDQEGCHATFWRDFTAYHCQSIPHAICLAALKAVGVDCD